MSHFTVLVLGTEFGEMEVEELLYPYWELDLSLEDRIADDRSVFNPIIAEEDLIDEYLKWLKEKEENNYESSYQDKEEWAEDWNGYTLHNGSYGYWNNPNAKWDWYLIGGRWTGFFKAKQNTTKYIGKPGIMTDKVTPDSLMCDQIRKRDIDIDGLQEERIDKKEQLWWEAHTKYKDKPDMRDFVYGIKPGDTLESFIQKELERHPCQTFAVIKDGKWYQKGQMGWWAIVIDGKQECDWGCEFKALWDEIPEDAVLTIVDCHI